MTWCMSVQPQEEEEEDEMESKGVFSALPQIGY